MWISLQSIYVISWNCISPAECIAQGLGMGLIVFLIGQILWQELMRKFVWCPLSSFHWHCIEQELFSYHWLSLHVRRNFPEQDFHMLLSNNGKHILHQPHWTKACKWQIVHYWDFWASVKNSLSASWKDGSSKAQALKSDDIHDPTHHCKHPHP